MKTVVTISPDEAAEFIKTGGLAAFPTETVYGLGANVFEEAAVLKIFKAKGRPSDNPLIVHIADLAQIEQLAAKLPPVALNFIEKFFPGPLTLVLEKSRRVTPAATAGLNTVGIRMPRSDIAKRFLGACGVPVAAPSANLSGRPSPTDWNAVYDDLNGRIDCILKGEVTEIGLESTVVDCTGEFPVVLRPGSISLEQLKKIAADTQEYQTAASEPPRSPGMRHAHYSPAAQVKIVEPADAEPSERSAFIGLTRPRGHFKLMKICAGVDEYAHSLFMFFRECDRHGVQTIHCEAVSDEGIGTAVMDRLRRAAES
jgi:L-threonylcarbamoyladenylate synthase